MSLVLRPIHQVGHADYVSRLLEREARWFRFRAEPRLAEAHGPEQWNFVAVTPGRVPIGCGMLRAQVELPGVLVAHFAVDPMLRRKGAGRAIVGHLHTLAAFLDCGLVAAVLAENAPSLALCRTHFGEELYRGDVDGAEVVVFGDEAAELAIWGPGAAAAGAVTRMRA